MVCAAHSRYVSPVALRQARFEASPSGGWGGGGGAVRWTPDLMLGSWFKIFGPACSLFGDRKGMHPFRCNIDTTVRELQ